MGGKHLRQPHCVIAINLQHHAGLKHSNSTNVTLSVSPERARKPNCIRTETYLDSQSSRLRCPQRHGTPHPLSVAYGIRSQELATWVIRGEILLLLGLLRAWRELPYAMSLSEFRPSAPGGTCCLIFSSHKISAGWGLSMVIPGRLLKSVRELRYCQMYPYQQDHA